MIKICIYSGLANMRRISGEYAVSNLCVPSYAVQHEFGLTMPQLGILQSAMLVGYGIAQVQSYRKGAVNLVFRIISLCDAHKGIITCRTHRK